MTAEMLLSIGMLLLFAKIFGELAERFGVASLVGEIAAGIFVGPLLGIAQLGPFLNVIMTLGIVFLLFYSGLEVKLEDIRPDLYTASTLATLGGAASALLASAVSYYFFHDVLTSIIIGIVLISTSNGTVFRILAKTGNFKTAIGRLVIATTIADDVVSILALSFFTSLVLKSGVYVNELFTLLLISLGFYLFLLTAGTRVFSRFLSVTGLFRDEQIFLAMPVSIAFLASVFTENLGLSFATGAFLTGMAMSKSRFAETIIVPKMGIISNGFLIPLFYAAVGTLIIFSGINYFLVVMLLVAALLGKMVLFAAGYFIGLTTNEAKMLGIIMTPRGDSNIVFAQIALLLGTISLHLYSSLIFVIIATTLIAPVLLRVFGVK
ncbi:MAG: cation:proton antiporter [Candidatus Aenigmarchaeota archaeon]|nr:cation:proton antiporter [Candidatus Aenigmarchaeota archaeon]